MPQYIERRQRLSQVYDLLRGQPDCYFTAGMVARYIGLTRSPYLLGILSEIVDHPDSRVFRVPVTRLGKAAFGYYYSEKLTQTKLEIPPC